MKQYKGGVFFVDMLGIGALTRKQITITDLDYASRQIEHKEPNEHVLCANLLMAFRRVLLDVKKTHRSINVAQLSDCAFIWSEDILDVLNAARHFMWSSVRAGLFCRGGLAYGDIVEPDKINRAIGQFVLGEAATKAVELEGAGKGCRIFSDIDFPSAISGICDFYQQPFEPIKNPLDASIVDEFRWYLFENPIHSESIYRANKQSTPIAIMELVTLLRYSPMFNWNGSTKAGERHLAVSIESISSASKLFLPTEDYCFSAEYLLGHLGDRTEGVAEKIFHRFKREISDMVESDA